MGNVLSFPDEEEDWDHEIDWESTDSESEFVREPNDPEREISEEPTDPDPETTIEPKIPESKVIEEPSKPDPEITEEPSKPEPEITEEPSDPDPENAEEVRQPDPKVVTEPVSPKPEIPRQPRVPESLPPPEEEFTSPNIIKNLDKPLDDESFGLGVESNYDEMKEDILRKSREEGTQYVFRDASFPAADESLYFATNKWQGIEWKDPRSLSENPRLITNGIAADDINQGELGNCWWLCAIAAISRIPKCMNRIIPRDQTLSGDEYVGALHFRFWRFGSWVDVIVDDLLPTRHNNLVFGSSKDPNEFWLPFVEKAYAKIHGSYQAIEGGNALDALEDLTGGMAILYKLGEKTPNHLYKSLQQAFKHDSFATCSIDGGEESVDQRTGLVSSHAYTITGAKKVSYKGESVPLVRVRNPWGNNVEWKGRWSDNDMIWDEIEPSEKERLGHADVDNGEWWMDFDEFKNHFSDVTICSMGPDFDEDGAATGDQWYLSKAKGAWIKGSSAGGCLNNPKLFATNPQYYLELKEPDDFNPDMDNPEDQGKCSVVMGLMQEYRRVSKTEAVEKHHIGLTVYKVKSRPSGRLREKHFLYHRQLVNSGAFLNGREANITTQLNPGHYVIIPSTFSPDKSGTFLLRIFTEKKIELAELY